VPYEHELTKAFDCSRMTVNKALTQLARAGLIERRRKAGTFVTRPPARSAVLEIGDIRTEALALGGAYRFEVITRRRRAASADFGAGAALLELKCLHFAGDRPICFEERLINLEVIPEAAAEPFAELSPGAWLVRHAPWNSAEHRIRAAPAGALAAVRLKLKRGAACLVIERRTFNARGPVTVVRLTYPGDAHELVARFAPADS